jgi:hypothetical protein
MTVETGICREIQAPANAPIKIVPIGIKLFDQSNFPSSIPLLQSFLANYRILNVIELLEIDQFMNAIPLREAFHKFETMLTDAAHEVIRHADVKRAADAASKDVDVVTAYSQFTASGKLGRPVKPGDDDLLCGWGCASNITPPPAACAARGTVQAFRS